MVTRYPHSIVLDSDVWADRVRSGSLTCCVCNRNGARVRFALFGASAVLFCTYQVYINPIFPSFYIIEMHSSSSSSSPPLSSFSGSEYDQSRASTPISDFSVHGDLRNVPTPKSFVRISCAQGKPEELNVIFNEHASSGLLGLYLLRALNDRSGPADNQFNWTEESINIGDRSINYHLGTTPEGADLSQLEVLYKMSSSYNEIIWACSDNPVH